MVLTKKSSWFFDGNDSLDKYLSDIAKIPLLERAEEKRLAQLIKQGDDQAREKLIKANLRFVVTIAKQYQNQGLSLADLINEGNIGLMKAAKRFDEKRGFKFISYAVWWVRQSVLQALAEQSRIVRLPLNRVSVLHKIGKISTQLEQVKGRKPNPDEIAAELDFNVAEVTDTMKISNSHLSLDTPFSGAEENSLMDVLEDPTAVSPEEAMIQKNLRAEIERAINLLTPREAEVISLYYGFKETRALTLEEIGARFSLTRERIRQIKEKAIRRLKHKSRSQSLQQFLNS